VSKLHVLCNRNFQSNNEAPSGEVTPVIPKPSLYEVISASHHLQSFGNRRKLCEFEGIAGLLRLAQITT
jgi:hypothetical protein